LAGKNKAKVPPPVRMVTLSMRDRLRAILAGRRADLAERERDILAAVLTAAEAGQPIAKGTLDHAAGLLGRFR
jgi:hypothetical protein